MVTGQGQGMNSSYSRCERNNRMDFTIGVNVGDDGKILINVRIPDDEGFTIIEAERFATY